MQFIVCGLPRALRCSFLLQYMYLQVIDVRRRSLLSTVARKVVRSNPQNILLLALCHCVGSGDVQHMQSELLRGFYLCFDCASRLHVVMGLPPSLPVCRLLDFSMQTTYTPAQPSCLGTRSCDVGWLYPPSGKQVLLFCGLVYDAHYLAKGAAKCHPFGCCIVSIECISIL